jgi:hypothetical protein
VKLQPLGSFAMIALPGREKEEKMRRRVLVTGALTAAIGCFAIAPGIASANTAKIGSALALPMSLPGQVCTANCISLQQAQVGGNSPLPLTSPANGLVTSWAVRTGDPDALYHLRVLTPSAGNVYTATVTVSAPAPVPAGTTDSIITYPGNNAPIKEGQAIGILQTGNPEGLPQNTTNGISANVIANNFNGTFPDGSGGPFISDVQHELLLQATIQFCSVPALKGLKIGAAKQALVAADCVAKVKKKEARKRKNRARVLKQKTPPGTTAAPGTVVTILVGKKPK